MTSPQHFPYIPHARAAAIDDRLLAQIAQLADDARMGNVTAAEAEWVLSCAGPLLHELQSRRAAMAALQVGLDGSNIIQIGTIGGGPLIMGLPPLQLPLDAYAMRRIRLIGQDQAGRPTVVIHLNSDAELAAMRAFVASLPQDRSPAGAA